MRVFRGMVFRKDLEPFSRDGGVIVFDSNRQFEQPTERNDVQFS
jgi:hypothetical protein